MPYIKPEERPPIDSAIQTLKQHVNNSGQLNYAITVLCQECLKSKGINYENLNSIVGVLECAKLEFSRRKVAPYENKKIEENGDVNIL